MPCLRGDPVSDSIKFGGVTLDCPHAGELAAFYAEITGGEVTVPGDSWAMTTCPTMRYLPLVSSYLLGGTELQDMRCFVQARSSLWAIAGDRDAERAGYATVLGSCLSRCAHQAGFRT